MKVVILCGGFGTRLMKDIKSDEDGNYSYLLTLPKALLPIGRIPLLSHWMKIFQKCTSINHIYIETNDVFYCQLCQWSAEWPTYVSVVNDRSECNETRLGAVGSLQFATNHFKLENEDLIVMAGDTLFYEDFDLPKLLSKFSSLKACHDNSCLVTVYQCAENAVAKHGILEVDEKNGQVTSFLEKPSPDMTSSRLACPCFYILSSEAVRQVSVFLKEKESSPLSEKDATGNLLNHLYKKVPVFTHEISGRFDVGGLLSYVECNDYFSQTKR